MRCKTSARTAALLGSSGSKLSGALLLASATAEAGASEPATRRAPGSGGQQRTARKAVQRLERDIERASAREVELHARMAEATADPALLAELTTELTAAGTARGALEERWLAASEALES